MNERHTKPAWISTMEAARLVPSPRGKTHPATIVRWIMAGKLEGRRRGRWYFVRRRDVLALLHGEPVPVRQPVPDGRPAKVQPWSRRVLKEMGIEV